MTDPLSHPRVRAAMAAFPELSDVQVLTSMLVRVVAPHFVAGLVMEGDRCVAAAPILRACGVLGKDRATLSALFRAMGWRASLVGPSPPS